MDDRVYLLQTLDDALRCWDNRPWKATHYDRVAEIKKFLRLPGRSMLNVLILRFRDRMTGGPSITRLKARTFFGYPIEVFSVEHALWLCGFKQHPAEMRLTRFMIRDMRPDETFL
ncbi:MAG: hypothetical protein PVJ36_07200, partial [Nitrospirota bacterium]